jgi:predicted membrane-bound mannosyltransferase
MLKTLSAAFLATAVIAAPAFATEPAKDAPKTTQTAPVIKADQTQSKTSTTTAVKPEVKPTAKSDVKSDKKADATAKAMNANAAVLPSDQHKSVRSHRHHHKVISSKTKAVQPDLTKPAAPAKVEKRS